MSTPHPQQRLGGMSEFNPKSDNIKSYFERFKHFVDFNERPAAKKLKLLFNVLVGQAYEELKKILVPQKPTDQTFGQVRELLEHHFSPEYSVIAERCKFNGRMQQEGESVKDFMTKLKHLSCNYEFKAFLNEALRDRLVAGLRDEETQGILFATEGLTFEGACKIALEKELASRQTSELRTAEARPTEVHAISAIPDSRPDDQRNPWKNSQPTEASSAVEELHDRALSSAHEPQLLNKGSPYSDGQAESNRRSSPATSSHGVADFDVTQTAPGNAGQVTSTAARFQGEAPAPWRSNRTRRPLDKYQADDYRAKAM
ncbi:uncharacterized protein ISCGN_019114 [Ixodes scapularis]